jgi:hydroxymethylglutaryl-CoA synthase
MDMAHAGSSSAYRGPDFRKPHCRPRHFYSDSANETLRPRDFPVFTGQYSQLAYLDATALAVEDMLGQLDISPGRYYRREVHTIFFHRPFQLMPVQALSFMYVRGMARGTHWHGELRDLCKEAKVSYDAVLNEARSTPDLFEDICREKTVTDPYSVTRIAAKLLTKKTEFTDLVIQKMSLGSSLTSEMGNMYSASLPGWIASAFDEAVSSGNNITNQPMVAIGYGSGDAAEAFQLSPVLGWEKPARRILAQKALEKRIDLTQAQYEACHDGNFDSPEFVTHCCPQNEFIITHTGDRLEAAFQDLGVEYYEYVK